MMRKRVRTALTITGIAISICSIIIINIISENGKTAIRNELASLGIDSVSVTAKSHTMNEQDIETLRSINGVKNAVPFVLDISAMSVKGEQKDILLWGIDSGAGSMMSIELKYGRLIDKSDIRSGANVCMIDTFMANSLYGRDNVVGKSVMLPMKGVLQEYSIIGIISTGSGLLQNFIGDVVPSFIYLPYTTLLGYMGRSEFTQAAIKLEDEANTDLTCAAIQKRLELANNLKGEYTVENYAKQKERLDNLLGIVTIILSAIAAISLLVAGLGIMTTMTVSVNERMKEIGIKKSIGASKSTILAEFLFEAALMCLLGSVLGAIAGTSGAKIGGMIFNMDLKINFTSIIVCIIMSVIIGSLFGVYPALKAANLEPVDTLRHD